MSSTQFGSLLLLPQSHCASLVHELQLLTSSPLRAKSPFIPLRGITGLPQPIWAGWSSLPQAPLEQKVSADVEKDKDTSTLGIGDEEEMVIKKILMLLRRTTMTGFLDGETNQPSGGLNLPLASLHLLLLLSHLFLPVVVHCLSYHHHFLSSFSPSTSPAVCVPLWSSLYVLP